VQLLLASQSPRRRELLTALGFAVRFINIHVDETLDRPLPADQIAETLALRKSQGYDNSNLNDDEVLVTADTVVVHQQQVLGKPQDIDDARRMLRMLSGDKHQVFTGVCLKSSRHQRSFTEKTDVWFKQLTESEIDHYTTHYACLDKAGSYGIQDWIGMIGIERIDGCYYNVMGLPTARLYKELQAFLPDIH
jgi:septum formation protein